MENLIELTNIEFWRLYNAVNLTYDQLPGQTSPVDFFIKNTIKDFPSIKFHHTTKSNHIVFIFDSEDLVRFLLMYGSVWL